MDTVHREKSFFARIGSIGLLLASCSISPPVATGPETEHFRVFASPRSFDPPGRIYREQPDGQVFGVTKIDVQTQRGAEAIPKIETSANFSLREVLESIGVTANRLPASASAEISRKRGVTIEGLDASREFVDDDQLDQKLPDAFIGILVRPDNKYYVIRETISSRDINYRMDKAWIVAAGIDVEFRDMVESATQLDWGSNQTFSMKRTFDQPMRIWYKAERLDVSRPLGAGPGQPVRVQRRALAEGEALAISPDAPLVP